MNNLKTILSILIIPISYLLMGCSDNSQTSGTTALFDTKREAETAAKDFNCTGAHKMGEKWMPCKSHDAHKEQNGHHHHH